MSTNHHSFEACFHCLLIEFIVLKYASNMAICWWFLADSSYLDRIMLCCAIPQDALSRFHDQAFNSSGGVRMCSKVMLDMTQCRM